MVPAGTTITFDVTGTTDVYLATSGTVVRGTVVDVLSAFFQVYAVTVTEPTFAQDVLNGDLINTPYTAIVQLQTRTDYAMPDDIGSVVANAFYQAVGALPTVTPRGYGEPSQESAVNWSGAGLGSLLPSLTTASVVLLVGIVVVVYVLANGRNVGSLARALR